MLLALLYPANSHSSVVVFSFRKDWALDAAGKWQEHQYTGVAYPWFACGSGYVISRDLVEWIVINSQSLYSFQVVPRYTYPRMLCISSRLAVLSCIYRTLYREKTYLWGFGCLQSLLCTWMTEAFAAADMIVRGQRSAVSLFQN